MSLTNSSEAKTVGISKREFKRNEQMPDSVTVRKAIRNVFNAFQKKKKPIWRDCSLRSAFCLHGLLLFSLFTIVAVKGLSFRVRNVAGRFPFAIKTTPWIFQNQTSATSFLSVVFVLCVLHLACFDQALDRLVSANFMHLCTSISDLSTSSSSRGLTSFEWQILSWGWLRA